jgi:MbtH protein
MDKLSVAASQYQVLINDEEQYSLWPAAKAIPGGWKATGMRGEKDECAKFVDEAWTDMRPRSLRQNAKGA